MQPITETKPMTFIVHDKFFVKSCSTISNVPHSILKHLRLQAPILETFQRSHAPATPPTPTVFARQQSRAPAIHARTVEPAQTLAIWHHIPVPASSATREQTARLSTHATPIHASTVPPARTTPLSPRSPAPVREAGAALTAARTPTATPSIRVALKRVWRTPLKMGTIACAVRQALKERIAMSMSRV